MLSIWVVYDHPADFPDNVVARLWVLDKPTATYCIADSLKELRRKLPPGLVCLPRDPFDDPIILESWI